MARKYKVVIITSDGREEQDEVFDTEEDADAFGVQWCSEFAAGGEVLHMSNPGDYPDEDGGDCDHEVIEVDA